MYCLVQASTMQTVYICKFFELGKQIFSEDSFECQYPIRTNFNRASNEFYICTLFRHWSKESIRYVFVVSRLADCTWRINFLPIVESFGLLFLIDNFGKSDSCKYVLRNSVTYAGSITCCLVCSIQSICTYCTDTEEIITR